MQIENNDFCLVALNISQVQSIILEPSRFYDDLDIDQDLDEWPHDALKAVLPLYLERLENDQDELGYGPWIIIEKKDQLIIGDVGFKGKPNQGIVEIGYYIVPLFQRQGYASAVVNALCEWAFSRQDVHTVAATSDVSNIASRRVLEKCSFTFTERSGPILYFERRKEKTNA